MKKILFVIIALMAFGVMQSVAAPNTTRRERLTILKGNSLFEKGEYAAAIAEYQKALSDNPSSAWAQYNIYMSKIRLGSGKKNDENSKKMLDEGLNGLKNIASMADTYPELASFASYNLGNNAFRSQDYASAISLYKDALRANPANDDARRNLRIAQLKMNNNQNKDQNKDKNKDKDKEDKKDQDKQQDKDQNKDKNKNEDKKNQPPQPQKIDPQTADQILKAVENKENAARIRQSNRAKKNSDNSRSRKNW